MAAQRNDLFQPEVLRTHRPKPADTLTPIQADDVQYPDTEDVVHPSWLRQNLVYIGVGMLVMVTVWIIVTSFVLPFVYGTITHWNCGEARICQYELHVGHGGTSRFITQYYRNQVVIIEVAHNDFSHEKVYVAAVITKNDTTQHTIDLKTAYISKHATSGKPDLIVSVSGFAVPIVLYNTGTQFSTEEPNG